MVLCRVGGVAVARAKGRRRAAQQAVDVLDGVDGAVAPRGRVRLGDEVHVGEAAQIQLRVAVGRHGEEVDNAHRSSAKRRPEGSASLRAGMGFKPMVRSKYAKMSTFGVRCVRRRAGSARCSRAARGRSRGSRFSVAIRSSGHRACRVDLRSGSLEKDWALVRSVVEHAMLQQKKKTLLHA